VATADRLAERYIEGVIDDDEYWELMAIIQREYSEDY
jgi:hypothetical protein